MASLQETCDFPPSLPLMTYNQIKKHIVKNFGRAICNFASSDLARPYLERLVAKEGVKLDDFVQHVRKMKTKIVGLSHFRALLLQEKNENPTITTFKKLFKEISEIFIKYFSVNWIFDSKVQYKQAHLRFRFKILGRIKNPELFTYLQIDLESKKTN